jgi:hypothetical protein
MVLCELTLSGGSALLDGALLAISLLATAGGVVFWALVMRAVASVDHRQDQCEEGAKELAREVMQLRTDVAELRGELKSAREI